jgi:hypothetical protein
VSKLDWEKRKKVEQPKEKRRLSNCSKVLKAYENGTKRERERIIKLLESKMCGCLNMVKDKEFDRRESLMMHLYCDYKAFIIKYHIALIKGEQK